MVFGILRAILLLLNEFGDEASSLVVFVAVAVAVAVAAAAAATAAPGAAMLDLI